MITPRVVTRAVMKRLQPARGQSIQTAITAKAWPSRISTLASNIKKQDNDRAIADYTQAIQLEPKYALAYYYRGHAYNAKGDNDRAIVLRSSGHSWVFRGRAKNFAKCSDCGPPTKVLRTRGRPFDPNTDNHRSLGPPALPLHSTHRIRTEGNWRPFAIMKELDYAQFRPRSGREA